MHERDGTKIESNLRAIRQAAGLSQSELAGLAGVTRQTIGAVEAGLYAPTMGVGLRLARALGCGVEDLFRLPDDPPTVAAELLPPAVGEAAAPLRVQLARVGSRTLARPLDAYGPADGLVSPGQIDEPPHGKVVVRQIGRAS